MCQVGTAHIDMGRWRGCGRGLGQLIAFGFEQRGEVFVGATVQGQGVLAGGLQLGGVVVLGQAQDAQAGAIALRGVGFALQEGGDHLAAARCQFGGPVDQAGGGPL